MTREAAIARAEAYFDSGAYWADLARRVAMPTESQNELRVSAARLPTQKLGWTDAGWGAPGDSAGYGIFSFALGR